MTAAAADRKLPVRLRGVVLFYDRDRRLLFVHDEGAGIFVLLDSWPALSVGDVVEVSGLTDQGHFAPRIAGATVRVVGHQSLPAARQVHFTRLLSGYEDSQWIEIEGIVRTVFPLVQGRLFFDLTVAGVRIPVQFTPAWRGPVPPDLVDARVRVRAVVASRWNSNRQLAGVVLYVPLPENVTIGVPARDVHSLDVQPIGTLFRYTSAGGFEHRVRTAGTVTAVRGKQFYLRDDTGAVVAIATGYTPDVHVGDRVDLAGFPESGSHTPILRDVIVLGSRQGAAPEPVRATSAAILGGSFDSQLVALEATLIQRLVTSERQVLMLEDGGALFTAEIESAQPGLASIRQGSRIRVTGICNIQSDERENPRVPRSFKVLLRSAGDVTVLAAPSWWTLRHTIWVVAGLLTTILMVFGWVVVLRRRVRAQTAEIRERLEHEITLQAQYRELFENANDVVCTCDAGGRLTSWNRAGERISGYSRGDAIRMRLRDLAAEDHRERVDVALRQVIEDGTGVTFEADVITRDGRRVTLEFDSHSIHVNGHQVGVQAIGRNVTQRRKTEGVLRQAKDAAELANRAKSQFVTNMSHEVRTPLNGILGMTSVLLNTHVTDEQNHYLQMVKTSAESLMHIINDVLDFSKIEAGRLELHERPFELRECLADVLQGLALMARQSGLALSCRVAPRVPRVVVADGERVRQVLVNLVGNALKFTKDGNIRVEVDGELTGDPAGSKWRLKVRVTDTGIGVSPDKHRLIFEAFTQADSSTSRRHGGSGLGLAISSSLVRLMGGSMDVESEEGRGSTFSFTLPVGASVVVTEEPHLPPAAILVIDRDPATLDAVCERLAAAGLAPRSAASVDEAIRALHATNGREYRLALVDAQTAEGTMASLMSALRQHAPDARLILGALGPQHPDMEAARQFGAATLLPKPFRDNELLNACRTALEPRPEARIQAVTDRAAPSNRQSAATVLLVEDNVINQKVAEQILRRRGHEVRIACHGRQALEILEQWTPDLVLMDVQMPEMNGIDATVAIRARERMQGGHLPIVAMTAHAMAGDRERCLRAGMDDYLTKPVSPTALTETVERIVEQRTPQAAPVVRGVEAMPVNNSTSDVFDLETALERVDGDRGLLAEIVELFLQDIDGLMTDLGQAVTAGDAESIMRSAHRLKGSVATFAARPATEAALHLETMGRSGDVDEAPAAFATLQSELSRLRPALQSLAVSTES